MSLFYKTWKLGRINIRLDTQCHEDMVVFNDDLFYIFFNLNNICKDVIELVQAIIHSGLPPKYFLNLNQVRILLVKLRNI